MRRSPIVGNFYSRLRYALHFVKPHTALFILSLSLTFLSTIIALVNPYLLKIFFDDVLMNRELQMFYLVAGAFLVVFFVSKGMSFIQSLVSTRFSQKVNHDVRIAFFRHLSSLDRKFFHTQKTGDIISRFNTDTTSVLAFVNIVFNSGFISVLHSMSILAVSLTLSWQATIIALVAFPFYFLSEKYFVRRVKKKQHQVIRKSAGITSFLHERVPSIKMIQLFTRERTEIQAFRKKNKSRDRTSLKLVLLNQFSGSINSLILYIPSYLILVIGGYQVLNGVITIGALIALRSYIQTLFGPLSTITTLYRDIQINSISLNRVFKILNKKPRITSAPDAIQPKKADGSIEFRNVTFAYEKTPVLKKINFSVASGETIGIMGCSGEGKSTICDLLCRFYDPQNGQVLIGGHDLRRLDLTWLRQHVGVVSQDLALIDATVYENIRFGKPHARRNDAQKSAKRADAHSFISGLPKKYSTQVNESGNRLSGGQRQRIAIARAILRNSEILIFDEATSALDPRSEVRIREMIREQFKEKTCIVISHRISTLLDCDRILVLKNGRICESGTLEQLLTGNGVFRQFYNTQVAPLKNSTGTT